MRVWSLPSTLLLFALTLAVPAQAAGLKGNIVRVGETTRPTYILIVNGEPTPVPSLQGSDGTILMLSPSLSALRKSVDALHELDDWASQPNGPDAMITALVAAETAAARKEILYFTITMTEATVTDTSARSTSSAQSPWELFDEVPDGVTGFVVIGGDGTYLGYAKSASSAIAMLE